MAGDPPEGHVVLWEEEKHHIVLDVRKDKLYTFLVLK